LETDMIKLTIDLFLMQIKKETENLLVVGYVCRHPRKSITS